MVVSKLYYVFVIILGFLCLHLSLGMSSLPDDTGLSSTSTTKTSSSVKELLLDNNNNNNYYNDDDDDDNNNNNENSSSSTVLSPPDSIKLKPRIIYFNIMVAGLSGLGKTTLCDALFESWSKLSSDYDDEEESSLSSSSPFSSFTSSFNKKRKKSITTKPTSTSSSSSGKKKKMTTVVQRFPPLEWHDVQTNTILRVRIVDTPGFGNKINHKNSVQTITDYIQYCRNTKYKNEMSVVGRNNNKKKNRKKNYNNNNGYDDDDYGGGGDCLVHVCLYFLSPGRFLEIDKYFLKNVQREVPIVPIIAKADTLTDEEIANYRSMLKIIFRKDNIHVYDFDNDTDTGSHTTTNNNGSSNNSNNNNKYNRGRRRGEVLAIIGRDGYYPWGKSKSYDRNHSDLKLIRDMLLSQHTETLLEQSYNQYLEYRTTMIRKQKWNNSILYTILLGLVTYQLSGTMLLQQLISTNNKSIGESFSSLLNHIVGILGRFVPKRNNRQQKEGQLVGSSSTSSSTASSITDNQQGEEGGGEGKQKEEEKPTKIISRIKKKLGLN